MKRIWMTDSLDCEYGTEYYPGDIAEKICQYLRDNQSYDNQYIPEQNEEQDCVEALYQLHTICENQFNSDFYRTFYKVLACTASVMDLKKSTGCTPSYKQEDIPELKGCIVDIFEDYMEENDIEIKDEERELALIVDGMAAEQEYYRERPQNISMEEYVSAAVNKADEAFKEEGRSRIYGENYDRIGIIVESSLQDTPEIATMRIFLEFEQLLSENGYMIPFTQDERLDIQDQIKDTLEKYQEAL